MAQIGDVFRALVVGWWAARRGSIHIRAALVPMMLAALVSCGPPPTPEEVAAQQAAAHTEYVATITGRRDALRGETAQQMLERAPQALALARNFVDWAEVYEHGGTMNLTAEEETIRQEFKAILVRRQAQVMPLLRAAYGEQLGETLWRSNITVRVSGTGNRRIELVGGLFASNANVEDTHLELFPSYDLLRFRRASYRWIPSGEGVTYPMERNLGDGRGGDEDLLVRSHPEVHGRSDSYDLLRPVNDADAAEDVPPTRTAETPPMEPSEEPTPQPPVQAPASAAPNTPPLDAPTEEPAP